MKTIVVPMIYLVAIFLGSYSMSDEYPIVAIEDPDHQVLKQPAQIVSFPLSQDDRQWIRRMRKKLYALDGVGLAAPQVGINRRIVAVYIPGDMQQVWEHIIPYPMHILINASYEPIDDEGMSEDFEGCYSVHSVMGKVNRYNSIKLTYQDEQGNRHTSIESGFYARVLQHEIDHINGTLIIDRLTPESIQGSPAEMVKLRRSMLSEQQQQALSELAQKRQGTCHQ